MRIRLLIAVLAAFLFAGATEAQQHSITEKDLFSFRWIGDTQLSPDGSRAVFVQATVNAKREGYDTSLYLLDLTQEKSAPRRLTSGPHDSQPRWSPDGKQIAFARIGDKDGKPQPGQIYLLSLAGGDAQPLTSLEKGASAPHWSPDGSSIAVYGETPIVPEPKKPEMKDGEKKETEHKSDVRIITKAVYRSNGSGYLDGKDASQIYVYALPKEGESVAAPRVMTAGRFGVEEFVWAADSKRIYFTAERVDEPSYEQGTSEIDLVNLGAIAVEKGAEKIAPPLRW